MKIISSDDMRATDRRTAESFGVSLPQLMENAGRGVAEFILRQYPQAQRIGVVCGKGNNGGDGLVAARKLHEAGKQVQVLLLADSAAVKGDAAAMLPKVPVPVIAIRAEDDLSDEMAAQVFDNELLVDAILGSGFTPPVKGLYAAAIARLNRATVPVIAVDVPSGADSDSFAPQPAEGRARADAIVTFTAPRPGHIFGGLARGATVVCHIGSPGEAIESSLKLHVLTPRAIAALLVPRAAAANKGSFGHVLVVGGSVGKAGAAAMAGMAAMRSGAGLTTVATAKSVLPTVAGFAPELMTEPLDETESGSIALKSLEGGRLDAIMERKNVLAIGPGIGRDPETASCVRELLRSARAAVVLDADGLNAFEGCAEQLRGGKRRLVITPHPGEMARLLGCSVGEVQANRIRVARDFAREHECVVVLKGWRTVVAEPSGEAWINTTGNPGMAKGGSGDILTGMVAGLLAQFPEQATLAAATAAYLHGLAGDVARELVGELAMTATDLLRTLPSALARVNDWAGEPFVRVA